MVSHLLNTADIDKNIEDLVLSKTEGIPFFIEEFIKSLKERQIIKKENGTYRLNKDYKSISIPSTIQDVIMARVDHLSEGTREVLRTGSVIEREFSHELIQKVTELPEPELLSHLSSLRDAELLYERGIYPTSIYIFKHALTREAVYDSILSKKRKQIHAKIAHTIEEIHRENICDCYGILSNHCMASEDYEKAADYARLEARKYQKAASFRDAVEYAKRSITCLEKLPQNEDVQKRVIDARVLLSAYYLSLNYHIEAKDAVDPIVKVALNLNYQKRIPGIYLAVGVYYIFIEEDFSKGKQYLNDVFEIGAKVGDYLAIWFAEIHGD
jgi:predicted ATPase